MTDADMNNADISSAREAAGAFALVTPIRAIAPLGRGLINDTYLVTDGTGARTVLQRINRRAFPRPEWILENLRSLLAHVESRTTTLRLPAIVPAHDGRDWFIDADDGFWRMLGYVADSVTHDRLVNTSQAGEVGSALGRFHALVRDLPTERLHVTRGGFHQTPLYFARYREALAGASPSDSPALRFCTGFADSRESIVGILEDAKRQGVLIQAGLLHYDVGDCLRSACNVAGESPRSAAEAKFDLALCEALLARYLAETAGFLTPADIRFLPEAIRLIPFELGLRFLADHLNGNVYFKVQWPEQNLLRAETQFRLTESIETQLPAIRTIISDCIARA